MGILNRTPDSFYDKGATFSLDALLRRADRPGGRGCRHPRRRWGEGGTRPRGDRGRGARPGRPGHRGPARPLRRAVVGRHVAGVGGPRRVRSRGGHGQRHQRVRRSRLPGGRGRRPARRWWRPTSASARGSRTPSPVRRRGGVGAAISRAIAPHGPARPVSEPIGSCSTPGSTSARPRHSRSSCCGPRVSSPVWATRCCCRRRTRPSWG